MAVSYNALPIIPATSGASLVVSLAAGDEDIRACQALRYRIFAEEYQARLETPEPGLDIDLFDPYCLHLLVRDGATGEVVATTRLLLDRDARRAGMFYSETEFHLEPVLALNARILEVGRTCIRADYRTGNAIAVLWAGLARIVEMHDIDYLIGCASLPMVDEGAQALAVYDRLSEQYLVAPGLRVEPRLPVSAAHVSADITMALPPLLKAYLRLGAQIGGAPCWDPLFNVADLFIILDRDRLAQRYARRFLGQ
ncbi:MAG TPA: GNAT family N-acyltransferase [Gammaproteobacteria bacterium]